MARNDITNWILTSIIFFLLMKCARRLLTQTKRQATEGDAF